MLSQSNNVLRLLLLAGILFFSPLFLNSGTAMSAEVVDINRADVATMIANWKGIGEKKAKAIVSYRKKNGPFADISDLANVKGIGEGLIKNNRKYMSVKGGIKAAKKTTTKKADTKKASTKKTTSKKTDTKKAGTKKTDTKKSSTKKSSATKKSSKKDKKLIIKKKKN